MGIANQDLSWKGAPSGPDFRLIRDDVDSVDRNMAKANAVNSDARIMSRTEAILYYLHYYYGTYMYCC